MLQSSVFYSIKSIYFKYETIQQDLFVIGYTSKINCFMLTFKDMEKQDEVSATAYTGMIKHCMLTIVDLNTHIERK